MSRHQWRVLIVVGGLLVLLSCASISLFSFRASSPIAYPTGTSFLGQVTPTPSITVASTPSIRQERWALRLDYPRALRTGDEEVIRLTVRTTGDGTAILTIASPTPGRAVAPTSFAVPDLSATHTLEGQAKLDGDKSLNIRSPEQVKEIESNEGQRWEWILKPEEVGTKYVTASLRLVFTPRDPATNAQQVTRSISIDSQPLIVRDIFGFDGIIARRAAALVASASGAIVLVNNGADLWKKLHGGEDRPAPGPPARQRGGRQPGRRQR